MPYITVETSQAVDAQTKSALTADFWRSVELLPGKTQEWTMVNIADCQAMAFAGTKDGAAFVRVMLYGESTPEGYDSFTAKATRLVSEALHLSPQRVYVAYFSTRHWGWNGENF